MYKASGFILAYDEPRNAVTLRLRDLGLGGLNIFLHDTNRPQVDEAEEMRLRTMATGGRAILGGNDPLVAADGIDGALYVMQQFREPKEAQFLMWVYGIPDHVELAHWLTLAPGLIVMAFLVVMVILTPLIF